MKVKTSRFKKICEWDRSPTQRDNSQAHVNGSKFTDLPTVASISITRSSGALSPVILQISSSQQDQTKQTVNMEQAPSLTMTPESTTPTPKPETGATPPKTASPTPPTEPSTSDLAAIGEAAGETRGDTAAKDSPAPSGTSAQVPNTAQRAFQHGLSRENLEQEVHQVMGTFNSWWGGFKKQVSIYSHSQVSLSDAIPVSDRIYQSQSRGR